MRISESQIKRIIRNLLEAKTKQKFKNMFDDFIRDETNDFNENSVLIGEFPERVFRIQHILIHEIVNLFSQDLKEKFNNFVKLKIFLVDNFSEETNAILKICSMNKDTFFEETNIGNIRNANFNVYIDENFKPYLQYMITANSNELAEYAILKLDDEAELSIKTFFEDAFSNIISSFDIRKILEADFDCNTRLTHHTNSPFYFENNDVANKMFLKISSFFNTFSSQKNPLTDMIIASFERSGFEVAHAVDPYKGYHDTLSKVLDRISKNDSVFAHGIVQRFENITSDTFEELLADFNSLGYDISDYVTLGARSLEQRIKKYSDKGSFAITIDFSISVQGNMTVDSITIDFYGDKYDTINNIVEIYKMLDLGI